MLDTWFSSGLWPFSTLGWPDETSADLASWYPTSVLVTGFDIIFFWVARMTMMAGAFTGRMPFRDVYIHGLVRDENNRKMSKSAGNGIDPLPLIERYGADALRFALVREVTGAGQDIRLDYDRSKGSSATVEAARNFANKLWNATRFALMNLEGETPASLGAPDPARLQLADRWILSRLARVNGETAERYSRYGLGEAAKGLYEFAWNEVCDWTIELLKRRLNPRPATEGAALSPEALADQRTARQVLAKVLEELLVLLHPLMPHLSEELWHALTGAPETTFLALQPWPAADEAALDAGAGGALRRTDRGDPGGAQPAGGGGAQALPAGAGDVRDRPAGAGGGAARATAPTSTALTRAASVEVVDPPAAAGGAAPRGTAAWRG